MALDNHFFVRTSFAANEPPPVKIGGSINAIVRNLFSGPFNITLTIMSAALLALILPKLVQFLLIDAVWSGSGREACIGVSGACWPFVQAKIGQFIYGFYPEAERWRPNIVFAIGVLLFAPLLIPAAPLKRINALLFFGLYPVGAFVLLTGGNLELQRFMIGRIINWSELTGIGSSLGLRWSFWSDYIATSLLTALIASALAMITGRHARATAIITTMLFAMFGLVLFIFDCDFGLQPVETGRWGGLLVTLVVAVTGIVMSLPFGILLALGRRSEMPLVRIFSVIFIEFWRGVPLITVLFFATYVLPLFLPQGVRVDVLLRALIGVTLFSAAYMAEVVRGGLQAISRGQYEAAQALGLGYWRTMALVVMPQALTLVIPGIVNNFIGLFKDTTLVLIVAIFDLLGQLRASFSDPAWAGPTTLFTGFAFAGMIYFVFCFGMSRYALYLEHRAGASTRR